MPKPGPTAWALIGLIAASVVIDGARGFLPAFPRGDLLYHWGLSHTIVRGELPPGGPYAGLPAYYPPGFHLLLVGASALTTLSIEAVTLVLGMAWLVVLPVTTFALARRLTGRGDIALVAVAVTLFAGAFDVSANRLWVNSLFLSGHQFYPLYPRDVVFGMLPLALLAFVDGLEADRGIRSLVIAGVVLGLCAVVQVQLLLPIPIVLATVALAAAATDPRRRRRAAMSFLVTGAIAAVMVLPWLLAIVGSIRRNGGVTLDSAETLLPAQIGFWDYPREFGLFLPLALVGIGVVLVHLRSTAREVSGIRPRRIETPLLLVAWFVVPWLLAAAYDPGWPLEDALRPQRLWLLSSQPGAILAAIGLVSVARRLVTTRWPGRWRLAAAVAAVIVVMALPTVAFTERLLFRQWLAPGYASLDLERDLVPDMADLLGTTGPRSTVVTYEDWSSLVWYQTGLSVVAVKPPGYAKLAFDPGVFTGRSQPQRRDDLSAALEGDPAKLVAVADAYHADRILLARRGNSWGIVDQVAVLAAETPGSLAGPTELLDGNGWDAVRLGIGGKLELRIDRPSEPVTLELRFLGENGNRPAPDRRIRLIATGGGADRTLTDLVVPTTAVEAWQVVTATVTLGPGERLAVEALDPAVLQSVLGFATTAVPAGWRVTGSTPGAVLLQRSP